MKNKNSPETSENTSPQSEADPAIPDWRKIYECPPSSVGRCYFVMGPGTEKIPPSLSPILKPVVAGILTELEKEHPNQDVIEFLLENFDPKVLKAVKQSLSVGKSFPAIARLTLYDPRFGLVSPQTLQTFFETIHRGPGRRAKPLRKFVDAYFVLHEITLEKVCKDRQGLLKTIYAEAKEMLRLDEANHDKDWRFIRDAVNSTFPLPLDRKSQTPKGRQAVFTAKRRK